MAGYQKMNRSVNKTINIASAVIDLYGTYMTTKAISGSIIYNEPKGLTPSKYGVSMKYWTQLS